MRLFISLLILCFVGGQFVSAAELTGVEKATAKKIADFVKEAGTKYQAGEYEPAAASVTAAMDAIDAAMKAAGPEFYDAIAPAFPRIAKAQAMLELEGIPVRPFTLPKKPDVKPKTPPPPRPVKKTPEPAKTVPASQPPNAFSAAMQPISFVKTVAPILVEHCGGCHVTSAKGNFSMATFAMLAKGPPEGVVIFPGDVIGSRLIETIETGDMPRGGGKVPAAQLKTLKDWIAGGARFDGPSPDVPLAAMATGKPAPPPTPAPEPAKVRRATGSETVSFSKDIAPVLLKNCNGCHVDAMQTRGGLRMDTFAQLLRGGDSGVIVEGEKSATSLLVRKLKGEEGDRMPAGGRPPLSDETITLISRWIDEGAALDGESEDQPIRVMASLAWVKTATDEQINERRAKQATDNLNLVTGEAPKSSGIATERFLVIGDAGEGTMKAVSNSAAKAWDEIAPWVKLDAIRGRITIFVMSKRYDYSEFAKMVEKRSIPTEWQSHWSYDGIDAYVAVVASSADDDDAIKAKLVGPLASLAIATRSGGVPRWFSEGVGRATAAKVIGRELSTLEAWNRDLPSAVAVMKDGTQLTKSELAPEQADLIAYGVVTAMLSRNQRRQYDTLLRTMPSASSFDAAFEQSFGVQPAAYVTGLKKLSGP